MNYRTQVVFRITSQWLVYSDAKPDAPYSWTPESTFETSNPRLSRSVAWHSSQLLLVSKPVPGPPHISQMLPKGIRFVLCCVRSTLITASRLLSFPTGTKMLQFPAFPIVTNEFRHPRFKACMRLAVAYRSLPRPSSAPEPSYPLNGLRILKPTGLPMQQLLHISQMGLCKLQIA